MSGEVGKGTTCCKEIPFFAFIPNFSIWKYAGLLKLTTNFPIVLTINLYLAIRKVNRTRTIKVDTSQIQHQHIVNENP